MADTAPLSTAAEAPPVDHTPHALRAALDEVLASDAVAVRVVAMLEPNHPSMRQRVFVDVHGMGTFGILPRPDCGCCDGKPSFRTIKGEPCKRPGCVGERIQVLAGLARTDATLSKSILPDDGPDNGCPQRPHAIIDGEPCCDKAVKAA